MHRLLTAAALAASMAVVVLAQQSATFVLKSGERLNGTLGYDGGADFKLTVDGRERSIPQDQIAVIAFVPGDPPATELRALPGSDQPIELERNTVVMRDGATVRGKVYTISRDGRMITIDTTNGRRDIPTDQVARLYMSAPGARAVYAQGSGGGVATSGIGGVTTVTVPANQEWTSTNLVVRAGETVNFTVSGAVRFSPQEADWSLPAGDPQQRMGPSAPLQRAPKGALLGRIDQGQPFLIGAQRSARMPANGTLFLGINDDLVSDNSGEYHVTVQPRRR